MSVSLEFQEEFINDLLSDGQIDNEEALFLKNRSKLI